MHDWSKQNLVEDIEYVVCRFMGRAYLTPKERYRFIIQSLKEITLKIEEQHIREAQEPMDEKPSSDTFRCEYRRLNPENLMLINEMKVAFSAVEHYIKQIESRGMWIAITKLEEACMWATKAIVLEDEKLGGKPILFSKR